jgi:hypothetical protein
MEGFSFRILFLIETAGFGLQLDRISRPGFLCGSEAGFRVARRFFPIAG